MKGIHKNFFDFYYGQLESILPEFDRSRPEHPQGLTLGPLLFRLCSVDIPASTKRHRITQNHLVSSCIDSNPLKHTSNIVRCMKILYQRVQVSENLSK